MAEAHKRAYRHPKYKTSYRIKNWPEYEKSLRNRGDITFWISQDAIDAWTPPKNRKRGGQPIYSDLAIETSLTLRLVFHLPLHQAEGFLKNRFMPKSRMLITSLPRDRRFTGLSERCFSGVMEKTLILALLWLNDRFHGVSMILRRED